jgi:hypothetical protein
MVMRLGRLEMLGYALALWLMAAGFALLMPLWWLEMRIRRLFA